MDISRISVLLLISVLGSCTSKQPESTGSYLTSKMAWLEGNWYNSSAEAMMYENWHMVNDSLYSGNSFLIQGHDTVFSEKISLEIRNGKVNYIPSVGGQNDGKPILFSLADDHNGLFIFENKEHDFPQRIVYSHPHPDSLLAWIEGNDKGNFRKEIFRYAKIPGTSPRK
jgi:hypothetical protein